MTSLYTFDRDAAQDTTPTTDGSLRYHRANARRLLAGHPGAVRVVVVDRSRSTGATRYEPAADEIIYVPATGGRWGKSAICRVGRGCR